MERFTLKSQPLKVYIFKGVFMNIYYLYLLDYFKSLNVVAFPLIGIEKNNDFIEEKRQKKKHRKSKLKKYNYIKDNRK